MGSICGANCQECSASENCRGCEATCGKPFGGACVAAEYIKVGGKKPYEDFKRVLLAEINTLLEANRIPAAEKLYELAGSFVNLAYPLPSGDKIKILDDTKIYLGTQIEFADAGVCYGVVADTTFILVCRYGFDGSEPELIAFQKR